MIVLSQSQHFLRPFPHFVREEALQPEYGEDLLLWLESLQCWRVHSEPDFYDALDLNLRHVVLPDRHAVLTGDALIGELRKQMQFAFMTEFEPRVDVMAHKLVPGYKIRIHNDFGPLGQTHRLLVQLNRGWTVEQGGLLLMLGSGDWSERQPDDRAYLPKHGTALGFEISARSFHAVTEVQRGDRYTLCYSFYARHGGAASAVATVS